MIFYFNVILQTINRIQCLLIEDSGISRYFIEMISWRPSIICLTCCECCGRPLAPRGSGHTFAAKWRFQKVIHSFIQFQYWFVSLTIQPPSISNSFSLCESFMGLSAQSSTGPLASCTLLATGSSTSPFSFLPIKKFLNWLRFSLMIGRMGSILQSVQFTEKVYCVCGQTCR